jgi:hypothetical protein
MQVTARDKYKHMLINAKFSTLFIFVHTTRIIGEESRCGGQISFELPEPLLWHCADDW